MAYRAYVTDALQVIAENTATADAILSRGEMPGKIMTRRWMDWDKAAPPPETRTPEQIIAQIKAKADGIREGGG